MAEEKSIIFAVLAVVVLVTAVGLVYMMKAGPGRATNQNTEFEGLQHWPEFPTLAPQPAPTYNAYTTNVGRPNVFQGKTAPSPAPTTQPTTTTISKTTTQPTIAGPTTGCSGKRCMTHNDCRGCYPYRCGSTAIIEAYDAETGNPSKWHYECI